MVARLVAAGHDVSVLGRSNDKRSTIAELGAEAVDGRPAPPPTWW
jgi:3-hydroxyisobutyrate dehydrogenase-like beta-hydroxyacid dehydrogenase